MLPHSEAVASGKKPLCKENNLLDWSFYQVTEVHIVGIQLLTVVHVLLWTICQPRYLSPINGKKLAQAKTDQMGGRAFTAMLYTVYP